MSDSQDNYDYKSVLGQVTYHVLDHVVKTLVIGKNQLPFPVTSVKSYIFHSSKSSIPFFDDKRKLENFCEEVVGLLKLESKLRSGEKVRQDRSTVPCFWLSDSYFYSLNKAENTVASAVESVSSVPTAEYIAVLKAICNYFVRSALLKITVTTPYPVRSILSEVSNISFLQQFNAVHCERRALLNDILKRMKADNRLSYDSNKEVFWLAEETNDYDEDEDSPPKVHSSPPAPLTRKTSGGVVLNMGYPVAGVAGSNSKPSSDKVKTSAVLKDALRIRSDDFAASAHTTDETDKGFKFNVTFVGKPSQTASLSASVVPAVKATKSSNTPSPAAVAITTEDASKSANSSTKANKEPKESIPIDPLHLQRIVAHCARLMIKRLNVKQPFRIQEMIPMMLHKLFAPSADVPPFKPGPRFDAYFEQLVAAFKRDERFRLDSTYRLNNDPNQLVDVIWISHGKQFLPVPPSKPSVDTASSAPNPQTNSKLPSAAPSNSFPPMPPTAQIHTAPPEFGGLRIVAPDHEQDEVSASLPDVPRLIPLFLDIVLKKLAVSQPYVIDNIRSHLNDREFLQKHSLRGYQTREQMEAVCRAIIAALKKSPQLAYDEDSYSKAKQTRTTEVFWLTNGSRVPTVGTVDPTRLAANAQALRDNSRASNRNNRNGDKSNNNSKPSVSTTPAVLPPAVLEKNERWTSDKRNPKYYLKGEHNPYIDTQKYKSAVERLAKHFLTLALEHFDSFAAAAADPVYAVANISAALRDGDSLTLAADGSNARQISLSDILVKHEVDAKQLLFDVCQTVKNMRKMKFNSVQGKLEMGYFSPQQDNSDHTNTHTSTANKRDRDDSLGGTEMWESARKDVDSMDDWRQSHDAFAEEYAQAKVNNSSSLRIPPPDVVLDHKQLLQQQQQQQKAAVASNKPAVEPTKPPSAPSKHATPLFKLALSGALGNDSTKSSPQRPEPSVSAQPSVAQPPVVSDVAGAKPVAGGPPPGFAPPGLGAGPPGIAPSVVPPASTQQKPNPTAAPADLSASRNTPSPMSMLLGLHDPKPKPSAVNDTISSAAAGASAAATAANSSDVPSAPPAAPSNPVPKPFEFTAMSTKFQVDGADLVSAFSLPVVAPKGTTATLATGATSSASGSADDVSAEAQRKAAMDAHFIRVMEQQKTQRPQSNVYGQSGVLPPHQQQQQHLHQMAQGPPPPKPQPMSYESFLNAKLRPTLAQQGLGLSVSGGQPRPVMSADPRLGMDPRLAAEQQRRLLLEQQQQQQQQRGMVYSQHQQAQLGLQQHQQQPPAPLPGQRLLTPQQQQLQQRYLQQLAQNPTLQGIKDVLPRVPPVSQPQVQHTPYGGPPVNPSAVPPRPQPLSQAEYIAMMQEKQRQALLQQQQRASVPGGLFGQPTIPPPVKAQRESSSSSEPSDELFFMPKDLLSVLDDDDSASDDDSNDGSAPNAGDVSSSLVQPLNSDLFNFEVADVRPVAVARAVEEPITVNVSAVDQSPVVEEPALVPVEPSIVIPVEEPAQVPVEEPVSLAPVVEEPAEEELASVVVEEPAEEEPADEEPASVLVEEPVSLAPLVEEPVSPVVEEPAKEEPAKEESASVVVEEPASPVVEEPAEEEPASVVVEEPASPVVVDETASPVVEEPASPVVEEPAKEESASVVVEEPASPVVEEPAEEEPASVVVEEPAQVPMEESVSVAPVEESAQIVIEEPASVPVEPSFQMPVGESLVEEPAVVEPAVDELAPVFSVAESVALEAPVEEPTQAAADTSAPATIDQPVDSSVTTAPSLDTGDTLSGAPTEADRNLETDPSA